MLEIIEQLHTDNRDRLEQYLRDANFYSASDEILPCSHNLDDRTDIYEAAIKVLARLLRKVEHVEHSSTSVQVAQTTVDSIACQYLTIGNKNDYTDHRLVAEAGLASLQLLNTRLHCKLTEDSLLLLIPYTSPSAPWTTSAAVLWSSRLLGSSIPVHKVDDFITRRLLRSHLGTLLSYRSTATSRTSETGIEESHVDPLLIRAGVTRFDVGVSFVCQLGWAVCTASIACVEQGWPAFIPPLTTAIESSDPVVRIRGLNSLTEFLGKCPRRILSSTGLGDVFQQAVFPSLQYASSMGAGHDRVELMHATFKTLMCLVQTLPAENNLSRCYLLDKLLREGVLGEFPHVAGDSNVSLLLLDYMVSLIDAMGLATTKHLEKLLTLVGSIMIDPFGLTRPALMLSGTTALLAVARNTWPVLSSNQNHTENILRIVSICYVRLSDDGPSAEFATSHRFEIINQLRLILQVLQASGMAKDSSISHSMKACLAKAPALRELLQV